MGPSVLYTRPDTDMRLPNGSWAKPCTHVSYFTQTAVPIFENSPKSWLQTRLRLGFLECLPQCVT